MALCARQTQVKMESLDVFLTQIGMDGAGVGWSEQPLYGKNHESSPDSRGWLANAEGESDAASFPLHHFDAEFDEQLLWSGGTGTSSHPASDVACSSPFDALTPLHEDILYRGPVITQHVIDNNAIVPDGCLVDSELQKDLLISELLAFCTDVDYNYSSKCDDVIQTNTSYVAFPVEYCGSGQEDECCGGSSQVTDDFNLDWLKAFLDSEKPSKTELPTGPNQMEESPMDTSSSPLVEPISPPILSKVTKRPSTSPFKSTLTTVVQSPIRKPVRRTNSRAKRSRPSVRMTQRKREQNQRAAATYRVKKRGQEEEKMKIHQTLLTEKEALLGEQMDLKKSLMSTIRLIERKLAKMKG